MSDFEDVENEGVIKTKFKTQFNSEIFINSLGDYIYGIKLHPEDENNFDYQEYLLYPLKGHDVERLMEESLKVGKDLVLQECKNRPYDEIKEMCKFYNVSTEKELYKQL